MSFEKLHHMGDLAHDALPVRALSRRPAMPVPALVLAMAVACALLLALPGQTVTTKYVNDLFIFLDGAHRVALGQVPNRDFHTALGPLVFYLPAAGYLLSGSLGAAMPIGTALFILMLAPAMAHVLGSRLSPVIALPFAAFLLLILAVPMNLGEGVTALSFAMYYNRVGWAALATLLVMYLRPAEARTRQQLLDAASAALLVVAMLYTKISYGVVALAFLGFMLLDARQRRWAALALAVTLAAGLTVEAFWRSSAAHFADLLMAGRVSGGLRGKLDETVNAILRNLADYVLFALLVGLAAWRTRSLRDLLFYGFCAVSGFLILNQNFQAWGIVTLHAGAAVAAETLTRSDVPSAPRSGRPASSGAPLVMLALILPTIVHCSIALGLHAGLATARAGEAFGLAKFDRIRLADLWTPGEHASFTNYLASLQDGAHALAELDPRPDRVFVLDFVTPFSAGLGLEPPRGDSLWQHWGRTVDETNFIAPEELLRDVRVVMEPKSPIEGATADGLRQIYASYIAAEFHLVRETRHWKVYLRR